MRWIGECDCPEYLGNMFNGNECCIIANENCIQNEDVKNFKCCSGSKCIIPEGYLGNMNF